jgi:hypothetical protein
MKQLAFTMEQQTQTNWCWSAVATSVAQFYDSASGWTQCTLAAVELGRDCCLAPGPCNKDWFLDSALTRTGNLQAFVGGPQTLQTIQQEVDVDRPLGARIQWSGGGGHFVVITGYDEVSSLVTVEDPLNAGPVTLDYDAFVSSYEGLGSWSHSYFTS